MMGKGLHDKIRVARHNIEVKSYENVYYSQMKHMFAQDEETALEQIRMKLSKSKKWVGFRVFSGEYIQ